MGDDENPAYFIHEIKTKHYGVISVNVFLPSLTRFLPVKSPKTSLLTTPENTITYHNALCLSPQKIA